MTVAAISDLHGNLPIYPSDWWVNIEECEILLICGDIFPLYIQTNMPKCKEWLLEKFKPWAAELPVEKVIFIGGNHDFFCERCKKDMLHWFSKHDKVTYLHNSGIEYLSTQDSKAYSIFGSPYCHQFGSWAFMRDEETLVKKFEEIPENLDILITHDAPKLGTVGTILQSNRFNTEIDAGNEVLAEAILKKKPRYVFSGHIHSGNHNLETIDNVKLANCSILDEQYKLCYNPLIIKI